MPSPIERLVHDARGPLNTIAINAEVAKLLVQQPNQSEAIVTALQNILRECKLCSDILQRMVSEQPTAERQSEC